jgi:hypothetical protein
MSKPSTIAERLLARACICRDIADATLNEEWQANSSGWPWTAFKPPATPNPNRSTKSSQASPATAGQASDFISELSPFSW